MSILLDSANLEEIKEAAEMPYITGVTTNPKLIAKALEKSEVTEEEFLGYVGKIAEAYPGTIFVQVNFEKANEMIAEARKIHKTVGDRVVIKIPATVEGYRAMKVLSKDCITTAATAVFTGVQATMAFSSGADFAIPYYSRIDNMMADGLDVVEDIIDVIDNAFPDCFLLVASVKTPFQALELLREGVFGITIPMPLIKQMSQNTYTDRAVEDFSEALKIIG